jgi:hypothetical protein
MGDIQNIRPVINLLPLNSKSALLLILELDPVQVSLPAGVMLYSVSRGCYRGTARLQDLAKEELLALALSAFLLPAA